MIAWLLACGVPPTYHADIAPLIDASCLPCHATDGASGLPLDDVDALRANLPAVLAAIESGRMPAGNIDRSGACGSFIGNAPVDPTDHALLQAWADDGALEGTLDDDAPRPEAAPFTPDEVTALGPFGDARDHRCLLIDGDPEPGFLTGLRVIGDPVTAIHHAMLFTAPTASDVARARSLDAADDALGWACDTGPDVPDAALVGVWTPGEPIVTFPEGTGVWLPGGPLIVQLHLGAGADTAELALRRSPSVDHTLAYYPVAATGFVLPPGEPMVTWTQTVPLAGPDLTVFGVMPHQHARGRGLTLRRDDTCLVDAPRWDYRWQELASYTEPFALQGGTPLTLTCAFSTLDATTSTTWGEGVDDEMCMAFLLASR